MKKNLRLTLLLGPAGCGKTQHCTESFEEALKHSNDLLRDDLLFILPTAEHRARTIDLVLRGGLQGFFQRRITTFDRALKEFLKLGGIDFATDVTRRMMLREILSRLKLAYFDRAQITNGFLNLMSHVIIELKENLIRPGDLRKKLPALKQEFPEFDAKYDDLCLIYDAYEKELEARNLTDQRDSLRLLEEGLSRGEFEAPALSHIWIDGFSDFSKLQLAFIEFLTRHADQVTVTLTLDDDPLRAPLFELVSETRAALEDMGFETEWMNGQNHRAKHDELKVLEKNLFKSATSLRGGRKADEAIPSSEIAPRASARVLFGKNLTFFSESASPQKAGLAMTSEAVIQIFEATGLAGEMEMTAREIKRLVRAHKYNFSDIAVLFRITNPYVQVIRSVFGKFQIPYEIHERIRLKTTPVARTLSSFIEILLRQWNREDVFNFLKSSYVKLSLCHSERPRPYGPKGPEGSEESQVVDPSVAPQDDMHFHPDDINQLELTAFKKGIFKDRAYWLNTFPESTVLKQIAQFEDEFLKLKTARQFSIWVRNIMTAFGLLVFPDSSDEKTRLDRESAKRILMLLEELKQKHPARSLRGAPEGRRSNPGSEIASPQKAGLAMTDGTSDELRQIADEFLTLMEVDIFSVHSRDKNKVQIYNVSIARQKEYKAVFLAGLLEKQFPIQVKEDPILSDLERRALNQKGEFLKEQLKRQAFERYLFYLAATRASEHLILSYPRFNLEGKEALPSFYVDEVAELFPYPLPKKIQPITEVLPNWSDIATREEAETLVISTLWSSQKSFIGDLDADSRLKHSGMTEEMTFAIYNHLIEDPAFQKLMDRLRPIQGLIQDERIRPFFKREVWSPTWLEEYAECPFRFFADRLLKLETQIEGIDIKRRGTILHDVLEHFFKHQHDSKREISFEEAKRFCLAKLDELWEEEPLAGDRFYKIELERGKMREMILQILKLELVDKKPPIAGLKPVHFEFEFLDLVLKGKHRDIKLRGKIDRVDVDPEGKFGLVIDYKYGKSFKPSALLNGTLLQLPLYLIAIRDKLKLKPIGGHLYSLLKGASSGFHHKDNLSKAGVTTKKYNHYDDKQFEQVLDKSVQFAEKFVGEIEKGEIPVRPRDCVSYCDFSTICRIEKWRLKHIYREIEEADKKQV